MFTYFVLKELIKNIEESFKSGKYKRAVDEVYLLKEGFIDFFENFYNILIKFEKKEISSEIYKILFQVVFELHIDLDGLYVDYYSQGNKKESKLSSLLQKLDLSNEIEWFDLAHNLIGDIRDFIEFYYGPKEEVIKHCSSLEEIKDKINLLKSKQIDIFSLMHIFNGKYVYLEELTSNNHRELFNLMKNYEKEYRYYIDDRAIPDSYEEFLSILKRDFEYGRNYQFLVYRKSDKKLIGTIFFYRWVREYDGCDSVKISAFFIPEVSKTPLTFEALRSTLLFAIDVMEVDEVKFDCYQENEIMINLAKEIGAVEIDRSKSEVNPERELISFSISKKLMESLKEKVIDFEGKWETKSR